MKWTKTPVNKFAKIRNNLVDVLPTKDYSLLGLRLEGKGLFVRETKKGLDISAKKLTQLIENDFIYSRLFAWKGAFDKISHDFAGMYVSNEFPSFEIDKKVVDIDFLEYYFNQSKVWFKVEQYCLGVTKASRNRFKEKFFLNLEIPLPPLPEQKRIVAKLDAVKSKIGEIKQLRREQEREIRNFQSSFFEDLLNAENCVPIGEVLIPQRESVELKPLEEYKQITVRMNHQGVVLRGLILGQDVGSKQYFASEGDFIISKIDARNAAMGIVPKELDGAIVTNDFPLYHLTNDIRVKYFDYFSNTYYFDTACKNASEGSTNRRRLKKDKFENILIPKPSIEKQDEIIKKLDKLNEIKTEHEATLNNLENLMPSLLDKAFKGEL